MAKKETKKAEKKSSTKPAKKSAVKKDAALEALPLEPLVACEKHPLYMHNVSKGTANWTVSGGGQKIRGCTPTGGSSKVSVEHCKKYKITFWGKDTKKKESASLGPDGSAIYNGRSVAVTQPH